MSTDLKDLRAKITIHAYSFLEARARVTGVDISSQVRDILQRWAEEQLHIATVADRLIRSEGMPGIAGEDEGTASARPRSTP